MYTGRLGGRARGGGKSHPMTTQLDERRRVVLHVALVELAARHANQRANQRLHAIAAVLIYALLARRRRCCESKQRSGKRE